MSSTAVMPRRGEVVHEGGMGDPAVGAPELLGHPRVPDRRAADVGLVDDRVGPAGAQRPVAVPVEERVHDHAAGHERRRVGVVALLRVRPPVPEHRFVPPDRSLDRLGVGIEEQLGGVAPQALVGRPRTVDAVAVALAGLHVGQLDVPDIPRALGQLDVFLVAVRVEQAEIDLLGDRRDDGKPGAHAVEGGAQWGGLPRPDPGVHGPSSAVVPEEGALERAL